MLTGDATTVTENFILNRFPDWFLPCEVLKIGHHGSSTTSTSATWADALTPVTAVASCGFTNAHGHPRKVVIDRLTPHTDDADPVHDFRWYTSRRIFEDRANFTESVYSTGTNGRIVISTDGASFSVTSGQ